MDRQGRPPDEVQDRLRDIGSTLRRLQEVLAEVEPLDEVLERLAATAVRTIPDAYAVGVTVVSDSHARTAAATDDIMIEIDRVQYAAGDGPCLEAARCGRPVRVRVREAHERWPAFAAAADRAGIRAFLSAPLALEGDAPDDRPVLGAVNVYGRSEDAFDTVDEALLELLTSAASAAIVNARRYRHFRELAENMANALTSRAEIDQAKGVLMARHGLSADEAFQLLVRKSQVSNVKVRDVARNLLKSLTGPGSG